MSSINTCLRTAGLNPRLCTPVLVEGLGGMVDFDTIVDLPVARQDGTSELVQCFAADAGHLPPSTHAIMGVPAISQLRISIDESLADKRRVLYAPPIISDLRKRQTAWNRLVAVMMFCFAAFMSSIVLHDGPVQAFAGNALLPGSDLGYSLFDPVPADAASPPFDAPYCFDAAQCFDEPPFPHFSDPPMCWVQCAKSAFTAGKGLRTTASIFIETGTADISVAVDTYSDVNLSQREFLHDIALISADPIRGTCGVTDFNEQGYLHVHRDGELVRVPAYVATTSGLPRNCNALFGIPAIESLGIDLNAQKAHPEHGLQCFIGERTLREWWDANGGASVDTKPFDLNAIAINPDLDYRPRSSTASKELSPSILPSLILHLERFLSLSTPTPSASTSNLIVCRKRSPNPDGPTHSRRSSPNGLATAWQTAPWNFPNPNGHPALTLCLKLLLANVPMTLTFLNVSCVCVAITASSIHKSPN
jgi:hypothetical protein